MKFAVMQFGSPIRAKWWFKPNCADNCGKPFGSGSLCMRCMLVQRAMWTIDIAHDERGGRTQHILYATGVKPSLVLQLGGLTKQAWLYTC